MFVVRRVCRVGSSTIPPPSRIVALRKRLRLSRQMFADRFGLDVRALQEWEQGRRVPDRAARVLLTVIDHDPEAVVRGTWQGCRRWTTGSFLRVVSDAFSAMHPPAPTVSRSSLVPVRRRHRHQYLDSPPAYCVKRRWTCFADPASIHWASNIVLNRNRTIDCAVRR